MTTTKTRQPARVIGLAAALMTASAIGVALSWPAPAMAAEPGSTNGQPPPRKGMAPASGVVTPAGAGSAQAPVASQRKGTGTGSDVIATPGAAPGTPSASGVIVTLRTPLADADARALLGAQGLVVQREIGRGAGTWLVDAPAGDASVALANRLAGSGLFASAQPNWVRPLVTK